MKIFIIFFILIVIAFSSSLTVPVKLSFSFSAYSRTDSSVSLFSGSIFKDEYTADELYWNVTAVINYENFTYQFQDDQMYYYNNLGDIVQSDCVAAADFFSEYNFQLAFSQATYIDRKYMCDAYILSQCPSSNALYRVDVMDQSFIICVTQPADPKQTVITGIFLQDYYITISNYQIGSNSIVPAVTSDLYDCYATQIFNSNGGDSWFNVEQSTSRSSIYWVVKDCYFIPDMMNQVFTNTWNNIIQAAAGTYPGVLSHCKTKTIIKTDTINQDWKNSTLLDYVGNILKGGSSDILLKNKILYGFGTGNLIIMNAMRNRTYKGKDPPRFLLDSSSGWVAIAPPFLGSAVADIFNLFQTSTINGASNLTFTDMLTQSILNSMGFLKCGSRKGSIDPNNPKRTIITQVCSSTIGMDNYVTTKTWWEYSEIIKKYVTAVMCGSATDVQTLAYDKNRKIFYTVQGDGFVPLTSCKLSSWKFTNDWTSNFYLTKLNHQDLVFIKNSNVVNIDTRSKQFLLCKGLKEPDFTNCMNYFKSKIPQPSRGLRTTCVKMISNSFRIGFNFIVFLLFFAQIFF